MVLLAGLMISHAEVVAVENANDGYEVWVGWTCLVPIPWIFPYRCQMLVTTHGIHASPEWELHDPKEP